MSACTLFLALVSPLAMVGSADKAAAATAPSLAEVVIARVGPGYTVTSQGSLDPSSFASSAPDPSVALVALSTLSSSVTTYERTWQAGGGANWVDDLLVRFPDEHRAQVFSQAAQHALTSGEIVDSTPLVSIPDARRVTYIAATNEKGVGEAITMRAGVGVDLLPIFSAASGDARPMAPAMVEHVARAQYAAMAQAPGGTPARSSVHTDTKGISAGTLGVAVVAVAVLAVAVATPALLRRQHEALVAASSSSGSGPPPPGAASARRAVDDLREHSG